MNYQTLELGKIEDLGEKVFLHDTLNLSGAEISLNKVAKGYKVPFKHKHKQNEEVYIILSGKGIMEIDNDRIDIQEGSVIKVTPEGIRTLENTSDSELIFIVIQTKSNSLEGFTMTDAEIV